MCLHLNEHVYGRTRERERVTDRQRETETERDSATHRSFRVDVFHHNEHVYGRESKRKREIDRSLWGTERKLLTVRLGYTCGSAFISTSMCMAWLYPFSAAYCRGDIACMYAHCVWESV